MGDNKEVMMGIERYEGVSYPVLTPNLKVRHVVELNKGR
jgi:hydroxymethylglutaryl-CoA lyase